MADITRHTAKAYALNGTIAENDAPRRIKHIFDAEWGDSTDVPEGKLREKLSYKEPVMGVFSDGEIVCNRPVAEMGHEKLATIKLTFIIGL